MRSLAAILLLTALCCTSACNPLRNTLPPLAIRLREGPTRESFEELLLVARAQNYLIEFADPEFGVFGVLSRVPPSRGTPALTFLVQCYADGGATLTVVGGARAGAGDLVRVPDRVRREAVALAQALEGRYSE